MTNVVLVDRRSLTPRLIGLSLNEGVEVSLEIAECDSPDMFQVSVLFVKQNVVLHRLALSSYSWNVLPVKAENAAEYVVLASKLVIRSGVRGMITIDMIITTHQCELQLPAAISDKDARPLFTRLLRAVS